MKQILCFGDSNTYGLIPGTTKRYKWEQRWTGILGEKFKNRNYRIIEEGLCGRTTIFDDPLRVGRRGTEILPILLESHKPVDTIILMLGTNDCKTFYDATAEIIGLGIKKLLDQIQESNPNTKVLLISPIYLGDGIWEEGYDQEFDLKSVETSKGFSKVYQKVAKERKIYFLDASKVVQASEIDREHLDEEGHRKLAEAIEKILNEILD